MDTMSKEMKDVRGTQGNKKKYAEVIDIKENFNYKKGNGRKKKENEQRKEKSQWKELNSWKE